MPIKYLNGNSGQEWRPSQVHKLLIIKLILGTVWVQRRVFGLFIVVTHTTPKFNGLKQEWYYTSQLSGPRGQHGSERQFLCSKGHQLGSLRYSSGAWACSLGPRKFPHKPSTLLLLGWLLSFHMASHCSGAFHTMVVIFLFWQLFCKNKEKGNGHSCGLDPGTHTVLQNSPSWRRRNIGPSTHFMMRRVSKHLWLYLIHHRGKSRFGPERSEKQPYEEVIIQTGLEGYGVFEKSWVSVSLNISISKYK